MNVPSELSITKQKLVSCAGRVVPATLAPLSAILVEDRQFSDIPQSVMLATVVGMVIAFFSTWSAWLSTGSTTARNEVNTTNGNA